MGYQNKGFENSGYNIAGATFLPVGKTADGLTLKDISASGDFVSSSIQFMTTGGANAKTTFNGNTVTAKYVYWPATDLPEDGEVANLQVVLLHPAGERQSPPPSRASRRPSDLRPARVRRR